MYYQTKVAPELANATRELATHLDNPGIEHWTKLERAVGYVTKTQDIGLTICRPRELRPIIDTDSNYAADAID